jgi:putative ABC transport system substrate-binding protein
LRKAARVADKVLRGASPSDLPVEQPTTFELVVNRKAAERLGIKLPASVLLRANRVVE